MKESKTLRQDESYVSDFVYIIELNRPEAMNSLNTLMAVEIIECLSFLKGEKILSVLVIGITEVILRV